MSTAVFRWCASCLIGILPQDVEVPRPRYEQRWVYCAQNLQVEANTDRAVELLKRAAVAGYNGFVLADYKLNILDRVPEHYFKNAKRLKEAADATGIELIPAIFPIGYSNGLLAHDPNLIEALPTTSHFLVRNGSVEHVPHKGGELTNPGLESHRDNKFAGLSFQDDPGSATVADTEVAHSGEVSCRMRDTHKSSTSGNSRLVESVPVNPGTCYRFSAWVKTRELAEHGNFRLLALGERSGRVLTFFEGGLEPTRDWFKVDIVFNSLESSRVNLYVGLWGGSPGTLWVDDLRLEEIALVNMVRRPGCPLEVSTPDGQITFEEGRDFEPLSDPKLGQVPYAGEFEFEHAAPHIKLTADSRIRNGQSLLVRWFHPVLVHGGQVSCCLSEPKVYELLEDQARRVEALFKPKTYLMSHDELRVANWCKSCRDRKLSPGALLADNLRRCTEILHRVSPRATVAVWSDMFDPFHNAVKEYYLVNGSLEGSWEGIEKSVIVANWNSGKARESLEFFAGRGNRQLIAGYYDADDLSGFTAWNQAVTRVPNIYGFMYTTWQNRYDLLEKYGAAIRQGAPR
jgi:hypothetical protein